MTLSFTGQHGGGVGLALGRVAVDRAPLHLAGLRVERDDGGVGLVQEDLAVGVGDAAVDRVAAHHRDHVRVLLRLVLPDDPAVLVQVERVDDVRERRVHVHHVADDERRALVAAQHAGREGPGDLEIADVVLVDLVERRVARVGVVAGLDRPVRRIARSPPSRCRWRRPARLLWPTAAATAGVTHRCVIVSSRM